jgi:hypothetical protein
MPICKECGFTSSRLQWTHFKYNCTGRFKNGKEYLKVYPTESLVDTELRKKTAVTLDNLKIKYGETEGKVKWDMYRSKQSFSNSFEYKKEKLGWTEEEFKNYNKSRSITLENMIKKYGETKGIEVWQNYCDRQHYTKTLNYFTEKYGIDEGTKKYLEINRKKAASSNPKILSEKLSITIDQAVNIICNRSSSRFTSNLEKEFIQMLESQIGPLDHSSLKSPFGKWSHELDRYVIYDIKHKNCIIEFNGDYWHANPKQYNETDHIRGKLVKDIWNFDAKKIHLAKNLGYKVLVIWESDYINNKANTIKETIEWISKEQK